MNKYFLDHLLRFKLPITIFVAIIAFTVTYFVSRSERDGVGYTPEQPIKFSHQLHAGQMKIDCEYCHTDVTKSRHASIPATNVCMNCHNLARKDRPEIIKLTKYFNEGKPIPWVRIHRVADFAYFNHSVHVNKGIACASCHGDVAQMDKVGQMNSFTMGACLNCHRDVHKKFPELKNAKLGPENCAACHR